MSHRILMMVVSAGLGVAAAACVAPQPEPGADPQPDQAATTDPAAEASDAARAGLLLQIDVEPGHTVSFYEPSPGGLFLAERMASGQRFVLHDHDAVDARAAFAALRPGQAVPAALAAAYDRARNLPSEPASVQTEPLVSLPGEPAATPVQAAAPGEVQQALTSSSAASNFVNVDGGCNWGPTGSACRVNWGGNFFASLNPRTSGLCIVDHYSGNGVTVQITAGDTITATFQAVHTSVQYGLGTPGPSILRRLDVLNASGDAIHAGCRWGV